MFSIFCSTDGNFMIFEPLIDEEHGVEIASVDTVCIPDVSPESQIQLNDLDLIVDDQQKENEAPMVNDTQNSSNQK